jgi:hypothetical protein
MRELMVPSSTIWVATRALASNDQKVAATRPACTAVITTREVLPWTRKEPVVISWKGRVRKYMSRKTRSSIRPAESGSSWVSPQPSVHVK